MPGETVKDTVYLAPERTGHGPGRLLLDACWQRACALACAR